MNPECPLRHWNLGFTGVQLNLFLLRSPAKLRLWCDRYTPWWFPARSTSRNMGELWVFFTFSKTTSSRKDKTHKPNEVCKQPADFDRVTNKRPLGVVAVGLYWWIQLGGEGQNLVSSKIIPNLFFWWKVWGRKSWISESDGRGIAGNNVGDFWIPVWPIFIKEHKEVRKHRHKSLGKYPAWPLVWYPMFLKLKITIVLIYRAYDICQPRC